jgi:DNA topoisomerase-1
MPSNLLIVESPSKAKTLKKYLGDDFEILASFGHVRDLEAKEGAVAPDSHFQMKYALIERNKKHVDAIAKAVARADNIYLATDPDREGEAIAWHIDEILKNKKLTKGKNIKRVVFYEITQSAVQDAVAHPRDIAMPLVNAQQARRALDHLVGFNLSPLLWRKISPGLSAGRVQSPALRLIVERELEIEAFKPQEYWTIHLDSHKGKQAFSARLFQHQGKKIEQFSVTAEDAQRQIVAELAQEGSEATVVRVERKPKQRNPAAPFTTSTLQQEAVRKLGFSAAHAMRIAQQLYEGVDIGTGTVGLITYMRTDSQNLAKEAIEEIRGYIGKQFDPDYLPKAAVHYKSKAMNAQEAHEAIRPTSAFRTPDSVKQFLTADQARLYEMIWKRTLACQMSPARFEATSLDIGVGTAGSLFRATGQTLVFPGFIAVYQEGRDDAEEDGEEKLPMLAEGEKIPVDKLYGEQHFTQPPPRYTEASLVKTLEEYGIGRPSTYATIISTLQDRGYAYLDKKRFMPTDIGRLVNCFLTVNFDHYVAYNFTADLENRLDDIANAKRDWVGVLDDFWKGFSSELAAKANVGRGCPLPDETCPKCGAPVLLQNSKRGMFVGCSAYPECDYTRPWGNQPQGPVVLGKHPETDLDVLLLKGPYGFYVQLGETPEEGKKKPKRVAWPKNIPAETANLEMALQLLALPREIGIHPETGKKIEASIGPYGPYLKHDGGFKSIPKTDSIFTIELPRAVELLAAAKERGGATALKQLGNHPADEKPVAVYSGRYGPYVKHGKTNATIPASIKPEEISLEQALELLVAREAKGGGKKSTAKKTTAGAAKKSSTKAAATKKSPAKAKTAKTPPKSKPKTAE